MIQIGYVPDPLPQPEKGHVCAVGEIPVCNSCQREPGIWDIRTKFGPWGNFCNTCAPSLAGSATTGVGRGQLWILRDS